MRVKPACLISDEGIKYTEPTTETPSIEQVTLNPAVRYTDIVDIGILNFGATRTARLHKVPS